MKNIMTLLMGHFEDLTRVIYDEWGDEKTELEVIIPKPMFTRLKYDFVRIQKDIDIKDFLQSGEKITIYSSHGTINIRGKEEK